MSGFIACSHVVAPTKNKLPELPNARMALLADEKLSTLQAGHGVFARQCFQCHAQPDMDKYSDSEWSTIAPTMSKHAGISKKESEQVLAYLLARKRLEGH